MSFSSVKKKENSYFSSEWSFGLIWDNMRQAEGIYADD
jgi:hypothetical protein